MTVDSLMNFLKSQLDEGVVAGDTEIRLQHQPRYPLEYNVEGVTTARRIATREAEDKGDPEDVPDEETLPADKNHVYLVEGSQIGYGNRSAWTTAEENF